MRSRKSSVRGGGFGITYLAYDAKLEKHFAIKEYLPIELSVREGDFSVHPVSDDHEKQYKWGLDSFIKEARTLSKFDHPNIVRVLSVTEENNTAYMVMAYEEGQSLQEKLKGRKTLEEAELLKILIPILGGLEVVHNAGFIHQDIKPDNIFIRKDGSPVLLDFGSARQALGEETRTLTSLVSPGYAPFEQYFSKGNKQGEWTDIYGLGATLYRGVAGVAPQDAVDRSNAIIDNAKDTNVSAVEVGKGKYSERFLAAIDHAIQFKPKDRPQTIAEWKKEFQLPEDPIKEAADIEQTSTQPGETALARQQSDVARKQKNTLIPIMAFVFTAALISLVATIYFDEETSQILQSTNIVSGGQKEDKIAHPIKAKEEKIQKEEERLKQQQHIAGLFKEAEEAISQDRLVEPDGDNAFDLYLQILKLESDNKEAIAGKSQVFKQLLSNAKDFIKENKFDDADRGLIRANAIEPDSVEVRLIRVSLEEAKKKAKRNALEEPQRLEAEAEQQRLEEEKRLAEKQAEEKRIKEAEEKRLVELAQKEKEAADRARLAAEEKRKAEQQSQNRFAGEMINIPAGSFQMGSNDGDSDEKPVHTVTIKAFLLGKYEVTQRQWRGVMGKDPDELHFKGCDDCPVERVNWDDVQAFIQRLNQKTGGHYRLPSEAEWEYACRSGGKQEKYCGGTSPSLVAWHGDNSSIKTHPVGQKRANGLGLYDMSGNVWEWVADCWNDGYSGAPSDGSVWTSGDCSRRVRRGGSWFNIPLDARSANRNWNTCTRRLNFGLGFRLAQDK